MRSNHTQPPLVIEPLYKQIQRLREESAISHNQKKNAPPHPQYTLKELILLWIKSLTPFQLKRPYSITEIIKLASLTGRYRSTPALQKVAQALRENGFKCKRSWSNASCNKRYWMYAGECDE